MDKPLLDKIKKSYDEHLILKQQSRRCKDLDKNISEAMKLRRLKMYALLRLTIKKYWQYHAVKRMRFIISANWEFIISLFLTLVGLMLTVTATTRSQPKRVQTKSAVSCMIFFKRILEII